MKRLEIKIIKNRGTTKHNRLEANSSPIAEPSVKAVSLKRNKTMNEHEERIAIIENAIFEIESIMSEVDSAISGTSLHAHYEAYGKYGFNQLLGNGNPYDSSLETLIKELKEK